MNTAYLYSEDLNRNGGLELTPIEVAMLKNYPLKLWPPVQGICMFRPKRRVFVRNILGLNSHGTATMF